MLALPLLDNLSQAQQAWLYFAAWVFGGIVAAWLAAKVWSRFCLRAVRTEATRGKPAALDATRRPLQVVVFLAAVSTGAGFCFEGIAHVTNHPVWPIARGIVFVGLVLAATLLAYLVTLSLLEWYSRRLADKPTGEPYREFVSSVRALTKFLFLIVCLSIIFGHFGVQVTGLLAAAGLVSLAVAFAAQETLANMIAGFVLMVDRPFRVGDRVQLPNGQIGDVQEIGLRSTKILSFDNTVITVPNSDVAKSQITNFSAPDPYVTIRQKIGVAYGSDLRKVKAILIEVMNGNCQVLQDPAPAVFFTDFGDSALQLLMICWVADYRNRLRITDELNMAIKDAFETGGVEIPFPQRDVHIRTMGQTQAAGRDGARPSSPPSASTPAGDTGGLQGPGESACQE